jgi:hypothetical protein
MSVGPARVAIVGSGELSQSHARVVVAHPDLRLVALITEDAPAGRVFADDIVRRFEGEHPPVFRTLGSALQAVDVDVVAVCETDDDTVAAAAQAGKAIIGGSARGTAAAAGRWFPFSVTPDPRGGGLGDAAFAEHLRQYESMLGRLGFGPPAQQVGENRNLSDQIFPERAGSTGTASATSTER